MNEKVVVVKVVGISNIGEKPVGVGVSGCVGGYVDWCVDTWDCCVDEVWAWMVEWIYGLVCGYLDVCVWVF